MIASPLGRFSEAASAYEEALSIQPRDYEAWVGLAAVKAALDLVEEEGEAYRQALAIRPTEPIAWLNLGISHTAGGRMEQAEEAFREAQRVAPDDPRPLLSLGRHLLKVSKPAEVRDRIASALCIRLEPLLPMLSNHPSTLVTHPPTCLAHLPTFPPPLTDVARLTLLLALLYMVPCTHATHPFHPTPTHPAHTTHQPITLLPHPAACFSPATAGDRHFLRRGDAQLRVLR